VSGKVGSGLPPPRLASASFAGFAMASTPFPIVLHDHTKAGIRWRVSIHPELSAEGTTVVRFLKLGEGCQAFAAS
jgi:hypothetical protein